MRLKCTILIRYSPTVQVYEVPGDLTVSGTWDVELGKSLVIFVPGTLTINELAANTKFIIREGGFLAFIVRGGTNNSGGIIVNETVGQSPLNYVTSSNVDRVLGTKLAGILITDRTLTTVASTGQDNQLVAAGTFVAETFVLNRNLGIDNLTNPGELFVYRPDLWKNAPEELKEIKLNWQEVAP